MDFDIQPLSLQQTNWLPFIDLHTKLFNVSPTRVLDENNLPLDKPSSFLKSIQTHFTGNPKRHLFFAIVGTCGPDTLIEIAGSSLSILSKESDEMRNIYLFIASATIQSWEESVQYLCSKHQKKLARQFGNKCVAFLEMAGFKQSSNRVVQADGTFIFN